MPTGWFATARDPKNAGIGSHTKILRKSQHQSAKSLTGKTMVFN